MEEFVKTGYQNRKEILCSVGIIGEAMEEYFSLAEEVQKVLGKGVVRPRSGLGSGG